MVNFRSFSNNGTNAAMLLCSATWSTGANSGHWGGRHVRGS